MLKILWRLWRKRKHAHSHNYNKNLRLKLSNFRFFLVFSRQKELSIHQILTLFHQVQILILQNSKCQGRSQTSEQDEASFERRRGEPLGGLGACAPPSLPPRKVWNLEAQKCSFKHFPWHFSPEKSILGKCS